MKVINNENKVIEVTKRAYEVLYKDRGFELYKDKQASKKPTTRKTTRNPASTSTKKVNADDK